MLERKDYASERADIIEVFTATQTKLEAQNAEIAEEQKVLAAEMAERRARIKSNSKIAKSNKGIVAKIKKLIS